MMKLTFFAVCALMLLFGVFTGFLRRTNRALVRLVTLLLSAVGAFLFAKFGVKMLGDSFAQSLVSELVSSPDIASYVESNPDFVELLLALLTAMIAPMLFLMAYVALKAVTLILYKIICWIFRIRGPKKLGRSMGALVGLLCGLIGVLVLVTPICGYVTFMGDVLESLVGDSESSTMQDIEMITEVADAPIAGTVYNVLGDVLFRQLTSVEWKDDTISLQEETATALEIVENLSVLTAAPSEGYGENEVKAMESAAAAIGESPLFSNLGSGLLAGMSNAWLHDGSFLGIGRPAMGEEIDLIMDGFFRVFSTSTPDNLGEDLGTFADIFGLLVENDLFSIMSGEGESEGAGDFTTQLTEDGVIDELYAVLDANPRMQPVKKAIADLGVRILLGELSVPDELRENHGALLNDIAGSLKSLADENGHVDADAFHAELDVILGEHSVGVTDATVQLVADGFSEEFTPEELQTLTTDEIVDRLIERFTHVHS